MSRAELNAAQFNATQADQSPVNPRRMLDATRELTFPAARLALARLLVAFCFVWPYFNYTLIDPDSKVEVNFLPVFLAAILLPEVTFRE